MKTEILAQGMTAADLDKLDLIADVQFFEPMGSAALNRKFYGIIPHGIYRGFQAVVRGGLKVSVGDSPINAAAVDVDGFMITVQGRRPVELTIPVGRKVYGVIEANYAVGRKTTQVDINASVKAADIRIINPDERRGNHVIIFSANLPAGTTEIRPDQIDLSERQEADIGSDAMERHTKDYLNPHAVTKAQVGLGNVQDFGVASTAEAQAGTAANKYMTPALTKAAITEQAGAAVSSHTGNKNNPHAVTKAQVGLGNADNTSDVNKPVSNATKTELGKKVNKTGDIMTGALTVQDVGAASFISSRGGYQATFGTSSTVNEFLFGGRIGTTGELTDYLRIGRNKLQFFSNGVVNDVYHVGRKPSKADVGLGNADNTSDVNKPVSNATKTELDKKVNKAGDTMTGALNVPNIKITGGDAGINNNSSLNLIRSGGNGIHTVVGNTSGNTYLDSQNGMVAVRAGIVEYRAYHQGFKPSKTDVGLGNVQDYGVASTAEAQAGTVANKYMTPALTKTAIESISSPVPLPDVWIPFNDSLRMITGFGDYDRVYIGEQYLELNSRSASFARATTATYIDKSGILRTAAINEPRFEKQGLLIEGQSTNLWPRSEGATQLWGCTNTTPITSAGWNMLRYSANSGAGASDVSVSGDGKYTVSVSFLITGVPAKFTFQTRNGTVFTSWFGIDETGNVISNPTTKFSNLTSVRFGDVVRVSATTPDLAGVTTIRFFRGDQVDGDTFGGLQLEALPFASSYIPTSGTAVTRGADKCWIQTSGNIAASPFTIALEVNFKGINSAGRYARLFTCEPTCYVFFTDTAMSGRFNRASEITSFSLSPIGRSVSGMVFDGASAKMFSNNKIGSSSVISSLSDNDVAGSLIFGTTTSLSAADTLFGHVRNFRIWHRALSDAQIKGLA